MNRKRLLTYFTGLLFLSLLLSGTAGLAVTGDELCDDGSTEDTCFVNSDKTFDDSDEIEGENLVVDATLTSSGTYELNFSGTVTFESDAVLDGGGDILAAEFEGFDNLDIEPGTPGNFYLCERNDGTTCEASTGEVALDTGYNISEDRFVYRTIEDDWTQGYLNWTDNVTRTIELDEEFDAVEVDYTASGLLEETEFEVREDGGLLSEVNSGVNLSFITQDDFSSGQGENVTFEDTVQLEATSTSDSNIGGTNLATTGFVYVTNEVEPTEDLWINSIKTYQIEQSTIDYYIENRDTGETIAEGEVINDGSDWNTHLIDSKLLESGTRYEIGLRHHSEDAWFGTDFGDYGQTEAGLTWPDNGDGGEPWTMGLGIVDGYENDGVFTSEPENTGEEVEWREISKDTSVPDNTNLNILYGENSTGEWIYHEEISLVPDSQFIRTKMELNTSDTTFTPSISTLDIGYNPQGNDGIIEFSRKLEAEHSFELGETSKPEAENPQQSDNLIPASESNMLSADGQDVFSGLNQAVLATNETGEMRNNTIYTEAYPNVFGERTPSFEWSNSSFEGVFEEIEWEIWFRDAAGNWESTETESFEVDGNPPDLEIMDFEGIVDVEVGSTDVLVSASDDETDVASVIIEENSTGGLENATVPETDTDNLYETEIEASEPSEVHFTVYAEDESGNIASESDTVSFQDIDIQSDVNDSEINTGEVFEVFGDAEILPYSEEVNSEIEIWASAVDWFELGTVNPEDGDFSLETSIGTAGSYDILINTTNEDDVSGESNEFLEVNLEIEASDTVFDETGNPHIDVETDSKELNLSAKIQEPEDDSVETVEAEVTGPEGTTETFALSVNEERTWFTVEDVPAEFSDKMGEYTVTFTATSTGGLSSNVVEDEFFVENITVDSVLEDENISVEEETEISGNVVLRPFNENTGGEELEASLDGDTVGSFPVSEGEYSGDIGFDEPGNKTVDLEYTDENGIKGVNTTDLQVFNLTAVIDDFEVIDRAGEGEKQVYRGGEVNFTDNLTADDRNPLPVFDTTLDYEEPDGWTREVYDSSIGTLKPGTWNENSPVLGVKEDAELGPVNINISTDTQEDIFSSDSQEIEVWTQSESEYLNMDYEEDNAINRNLDKFTVHAEVTDVNTDESLEGVGARFLLDGDEVGADVSNSTGGVSFNLDLEELDTGDFRGNLETFNNESIFINSSEDVTSNEIDVSITGVMQEGEQFTIDPVYRTADSGPSSTSISGKIEDSTGEELEDASVTATVNGEQIGTDTTDQDGFYSFSYSPGEELQPGEYNVTLQASKQDFSDFEFNRTVEVRGVLDIKNNFDRPVIGRGLEHVAESTVVDDFGESVTGNTTWRINETEVGTGKDTHISIPESQERGFYELEASTDREFFDDDESTVEVDVYGQASVDLSPDDFTIRSGNTVDFTASVIDDNSSEGIEDYPVEFDINGETHTRVTDETGTAALSWETEEGEYDVEASIADNQTLFYNATDDSGSTDVFVGDKMFLDTFEFSEDPVNRYPVTPDQTRIQVNLTQTSDTIERVPVEGEEIEFEINGTDTISCTTEQDGSCGGDFWYEPTSDVTPGNATVEATTDRPGWIDLDREERLAIRGLMLTSLDSPNDDENLARGDTINLQATTDTFSGGEIEREMIWTLDGEEVATGYNTDWEISAGQTTGQQELTATGDGEFFESDSESIDVWILGRASPELLEPEEETVGYAEPEVVRCEAASDAGGTIEDYPVEFIDNRSGTFEAFNSSITEVQGGEIYAEGLWKPPEEVTEVKMGCRINTNRSVGFTAEDETDTDVFSTEDDSPPEISNLESPTRVDPGDDALITFNVTDENGVEEIRETVLDPVFSTVEDVEIDDIEGTGVLVTVPTSETTQGTYTAEFEAEDVARNTETATTAFNVQPGGEIDLSNKMIEAENIDQNTALKEEVEVSLLLDNGGENVNLTADSDSDLEFNTSEVNCGAVGEDEYCNTTFEVTVPSGTPPTAGSPLFASFRGVWDRLEDGGEASLGDFTEVTVESNPVFTEETDDRTINQLTHESEPVNISDLAGEEAFKLNSSGNTPVEDFEALYHDKGLKNEWIEINEEDTGLIQAGTTTEADLEVDIPVGTPPGDYDGVLEFQASNTEEVNRTVTVDIGEDNEFTVIPDIDDEASVEASSVKGSSGELLEVGLEHEGNVDLDIDFTSNDPPSADTGVCAQNLDINESDLLLETQDSKNVSVMYDFTDVTVDACTSELEFDVPTGPTETLEVDITNLEFNISGETDEGEGLPGDERNVEFTAEIGEEVVNTGLDYSIFVNGTEASITGEEKTQGGDTFSVNYSIPDVPDARTHDVKLEVFDEENEVTQTEVFEDAVEVPDITPPEFGEVDNEGVDPGEDNLIEVSVTDNNLEGVENVSMNVSGPNISEVRGLDQDGESWSTTLEELETGLYEMTFTAEDPAGNKKAVNDSFRVANGTEISGSFTGSDNEAKEGARLTITDSDTGRTETVDIDGTGEYDFGELRTGNYDVNVKVDGQEINLEEASVDENTSTVLRAERLSDTQTSGLTPSDQTEERIMGIGVDTGLEPESSELTFNYSGIDIPSGFDISEFRIARCGDYDYESLTCSSDSFEIIDIDPLDVDKARETITVETSGFSSYTIFAPAEEEEEEDDSSDDSSSSGGGGGGGLTQEDIEEVNDTVSETQEQVENLSSQLNDSDSEGANLGSNSINAELRPGESQRVSISIANTADQEQTFIFSTSETVEDFINVTETLTLEGGESEDVNIDIGVPADELPGSYTGSFSVESPAINTELPVNIQVLPSQQELLDLSIDPVFSTIEPGDTLQIEASFSNQGYARNVDVTTDFEVVDPDRNETVVTAEETVAVGTTLNRIFEMEIPEDAELKSYAVRGTARYTNLDVPRVATASDSFTVNLPFWNRTLLGFTYGNIALGFLFMMLSGTIVGGLYQYKRKKELQKKRYMENIDMSTIPTGGRNQAYLGQLAEIGKRTFMRLDDLTTHALIAGATGSGKTVTGQVMVEEALENGANVIVLDPTAQWTGYLRANEDPNMTELYGKYGISKDDARGFDGNIRAVDPGDEIDITPYLEQDEDGQIIIFSLHKLDSKNIDEFANKTIQQVFDANLPERNGLETLIVYDEVHRLLEKFGGNGEGLKQLERGAREFRKWGVGMVLLSQVISDFSGEIRANIGTTVQMRTQYDDDLERIKNKFGIDTVKSIAKAEVGSGMLQNSDYNHGRPYFIDFRPLLHSPHRLSDEKLEKYEEYNKRIDAVEEKVEQLEEAGEEVYEYRSELKLTKRNLKKGSFTLVDTYIDELEEKLDIQGE